MEPSEKISNRWLTLLGADLLAMLLIYFVAGKSIVSWYKEQVNVNGITLITILIPIVFNVAAFLIINYIFYLLIIPKSMRNKTKHGEADKADRV